MKLGAKFSKFKFRRPSLLYPYPKLRPPKGSVLNLTVGNTKMKSQSNFTADMRKQAFWKHSTPSELNWISN